MHAANRPALALFSFSKTFCVALVFCAATAITAPAQTLTTLYSFCAQPDCVDGDTPFAPLVQATDGNFYGTTFEGGTYNAGTVFKVTPSGTLTTLHTFCSQPNCTDGYEPFGGLVQATDGNFYGTTEGSGVNVYGTVFRITPSGALTTLHTFEGSPADGAVPSATLVQAADGSLYGTTQGGGANQNCIEGCGTVFKITSSGTLTTLYSFCSQANCADGGQPLAGLVQATDGSFYGTTTLGGARNDGTVFKITSSGTLTMLHSFCSQTNCADGNSSDTGLVQGTDGNLYGVAVLGGANNVGTVFKITPTGSLTTLYNFDGIHGATPQGSLVQATDGNFYATTQAGGANGAGTVYKITPSGTLTTLYSFCSQPKCVDGNLPFAGLVQATDGSLYGTTLGGGVNSGDGTVFSLTGPAPTAVQFAPVTPCRVVDTRQADGEFGGPAIPGGTSRSFPIPQNPNCSIPPAAAYSLNVTVVPHQPLGYLTIWPSGRSQPGVSTMNSTDGRVKANAAIVPAGASAAVSVYASDTTDLILDIDGYFATPSSETYQFYKLTPCRLVDTRQADGNLGGPRLPAQTPRDFPLLSSPCIPSGLHPLAYSLNFTVVPNPSGQPLGYLSVWPAGEMQPVVSTLNNPTATVVANAAIVPAGTNGDIDVFAYNTTDLLIDIDGYFAAPGTNGLSMYPVAPCRVLDTRQVGNGRNGQPFTGTLSPPVNVVGSVCAPPSSALAYVFNATVVPSGSLGYLTLWPDGSGQPVVSTLNAVDGFITSNMAIVPTTNGSIDAYAAGLTQLILDISGYFAP